MLLIEDSPMYITLVGLYLKGEFPGVDVASAESLADGIAMAEAIRPDIILLDLTLPDSAGFATFERVRDAVRTPIVILSGDSDQEMANKAVREGAQDYIVKDDLKAAGLARSIRFALERAARKRAEAELNSARVVQQRLYPAESPSISGFDVSGDSYPAEETSGDYFDFIQLSEDRWLIAVGDVSGHGLAPALRMVETRAFLRATLAAAANGTTMQPGELLSRINDLVSTNEIEHFISMFIVVVDVKRHQMTFASAGHRSHFIHSDGRIEMLDATGPVLGLKNSTFESSQEIALSYGDIILINTDGFEESMNPAGDMFTRDRLIAVVSDHRQLSSAELIQQMHESVIEFSENTRQEDDMTAVVIKAI